MSDSLAFTPPPESNETGDVLQAHTRIWRKVKVSVEISAREATTDRDERDDLMQQARVLLWELDASRVDLENPEDVRVVRSILKKHIKGLAVAKKKERGVRIEELPKEARRVFR